MADETDSIPVAHSISRIPDERKNNLLHPADIPANYKMNHQNRGIAIIFNQLEFVSELPKRKAVDCDRISTELKELAFQVIVAENLTRKQIKLKLNEIAALDHSESDCLLVVVLSHGFSENKIWAKDKVYNTNLLYETFAGDKCKSLVGKPKLFFIQVSFEDTLQEMGSIESSIELYSFIPKKSPLRETIPLDEITIPKMADVLVLYSVLDKFLGMHNSSKGSYVIQALCDELRENGKVYDLFSILIRVTAVINDRPCEFDIPALHKMKRSPIILSTLTKFVYFADNKKINNI